MKFAADLHLHSPYSRAVSPRMTLKNLSRWGEVKGIRVLGAADFTHPKWLKKIKNELEPAENGLFKLKDKEHKTRFVLSSEISCIYPKNNRVRKIHIIVLAPSIKVVQKINSVLSKVGNLSADGRPILKLDAKELARIILSICDECLIIPAHLWTPWFSLFGSRSGFDSIEECFEDYADKIYAGETGMSSDPEMNWRLSQLDKIALISNSDAHSPENIGREANMFNTELSYEGIVDAIKTKDPVKFLYTIEFFPEEGKYYYDGHRVCGISLSPKETYKYGGLCPVCGKKLTIGVLNRVKELADREEGEKPKTAIPFKRLIPLVEIIAEVLGVGKKAKKVQKEYEELINVFGNELEILLNISLTELEKAVLPKIGKGIIRVRQGKVSINPGHDGLYGKIKIFGGRQKRAVVRQTPLV